MPWLFLNEINVFCLHQTLKQRKDEMSDFVRGKGNIFLLKCWGRWKNKTDQQQKQTTNLKSLT